MKISTDRIDVVPLCLEELETFIQSRAEYERIAKCQHSGVELPEAYREELSEILAQNRDVWNNKSLNYLFFTLWVMVSRDTRQIIGQFTFNGKPNANGEAEVFFSIEEPYRRKGYACEVMQGVLKWGGESKLFSVVLIEADFDNKAAMASLTKLGFKSIPRDDEEESLPKSTKYFKRVSKPETLEEELDFD